jgi:3-hydroxy-9,10-secoandrosta-1,3,5(10)-triene-9,17-dione monooxygenase reductase component
MGSSRTTSVIAESATPSAQRFKTALGAFASSVNVVTMWDGEGRPHGATVTAFSSVSLDPLLVLVCMNLRAKMFGFIRESGRLGVNILSEDGQEVSDYCARPGAIKLLPPTWLVPDRPTRSPALVDALAFLDCDVAQIVEAGTHGVVICAVRDIVASERVSAGPLVHFRGAYRQLETAVARICPRPLPIVVEDAS